MGLEGPSGIFVSTCRGGRMLDRLVVWMPARVEIFLLFLWLVVYGGVTTLVFLCMAPQTYSLYPHPGRAYPLCINLPWCWYRSGSLSDLPNTHTNINTHQVHLDWSRHNSLVPALRQDIRNDGRFPVLSHQWVRTTLCEMKHDLTILRKKWHLSALFLW